MTYREFKIKFGLVAAPQVTEKHAAPAQPPAKVEAPAQPQPPAKKRSHHKKR